MPQGEPERNRSFGARVAIDGDWLAVSEPSDNELGYYQGSIHIYRRMQNYQWVKVHHLRPWHRMDADLLGRWVLKIKGDELFVAGMKTGVAVYDMTAWLPEESAP